MFTISFKKKNEKMYNINKVKEFIKQINKKKLKKKLIITRVLHYSVLSVAPLNISHYINEYHNN